MSTKSTIILSNEGSHIYEDCINQFESNGNIVSEITFELDRRDLRIDSLDDQTLCFTLNKDSYMFKELRSILIKNNKKNEKF